MGINKIKGKLPLALTATSFIGLLLLTVGTSPITDIGYAAVFFVLLFVFLLSFGHLVLMTQNGTMSARARYRVLAFDLFIIIVLMFRSAQSLDLVNVVVLGLIVFGFLFYIGRRAS